jgi:hypothetical protein
MGYNMADLAKNVEPVSYVKAHTTDIIRNAGETISQKTLNAINLAKLLSFSEMDLKNGDIIPHEEAKKRFEKTIGK